MNNPLFESHIIAYAALSLVLRTLQNTDETKTDRIHDACEFLQEVLVTLEQMR